MRAAIVPKEVDYLFNHCTKYLARMNNDARHSFSGLTVTDQRGRISESWRFPIVDSDDSGVSDASEFNHVTFVFCQPESKSRQSIFLLTPCLDLFNPAPLQQAGDSIYFTLTLRIPKGWRDRYRFIVDGRASLDPINPQTMTTPQGEAWSSFWTWAYNEPINLDRWALALVERMTRALLPFQGRETRNLVERGLNDGNVQHFFRMDVSAGVANYIDNILAREERHHLQAYLTCLPFIDRVLRKRYPAIEPGAVDDLGFKAMFDEMKNASAALFADGWDVNVYKDPGYFLYILRRHAWTGAFSHPKYGGNPGGLGWSFLTDTYRTTANAAVTAYDWMRTIEPPLGSSTEYLG